MNSWKSFVKNVADKAQDFSSPVRMAGGNASGENASEDTQAEGFICPMCMKGFTDPVELQQCFNNCSSMTNSSNGTKGLQLKENLKALQNTLEEERRYSSQLQKEVNQFSEDVHRTTNHTASHHDSGRERSQLLEEEKALLETQVMALEEGKKLRGNLGLFTGMSILSIVEIGFWISRMLFGTTKRNKTMDIN